MSEPKRITREELAYNIVAMMTGLTVTEAEPVIKEPKKGRKPRPEQKEKCYTAAKRT